MFRFARILVVLCLTAAPTFAAVPRPAVSVSVLGRLMIWVQSKLSPPLPEPQPLTSTQLRAPRN